MNRLIEAAVARIRNGQGLTPELIQDIGNLRPPPNAPELASIRQALSQGTSYETDNSEAALVIKEYARRVKALRKSGKADAGLEFVTQR